MKSIKKYFIMFFATLLFSTILVSASSMEEMMFEEAFNMTEVEFENRIESKANEMFEQEDFEQRLENELQSSSSLEGAMMGVIIEIALGFSEEIFGKDSFLTKFIRKQVESKKDELVNELVSQTGGFEGMMEMAMDYEEGNLNESDDINWNHEEEMNIYYSENINL
jgi:hypothetical protein